MKEESWEGSATWRGWHSVPLPLPQTHTEGRSAQPEEKGCCGGVGVRAPERQARPGLPFFRRQSL